MPGDVTCMSSEQLSDWCDEEVNGKDLLQCHLSETIGRKLRAVLFKEIYF